MAGTMQSFVLCVVLQSKLCSIASLRCVLLRHLVVRFLVELDKIRDLACVDLVPLRHHVSVQVVSAAWRARVLSVSTCVARRRTLVGPPTAALRGGTGVPWVSLPGPKSAHSDAQEGMASGQSANTV